MFNYFIKRREAKKAEALARELERIDRKFARRTYYRNRDYCNAVYHFDK